MLPFITDSVVRASREPHSGDPPVRRRVPLREGWYVKQLESDKPDVAALVRDFESPDETWLPTNVPAQVHDVLFRHGLISDPRIGRNAADSAWVGEKDWAYICRFRTPQATAGPAFLRFEGLDTLAEAYLNGSSIGRFNDMHREYGVEIWDRLAPPGQPNILLVIFSSPLRFVREAKPPDHPSPGYKYLRKCHSDFWPYIGAYPHSAKVGIYGDVVLDLPGQAWIDDVWVRPELSGDYRSAVVRVRVDTAGSGAALEWELSGPAGEEVASGAADAPEGGIGLEIPIKAPKLWWPRTHGTPNLYKLRVSLLSGGRTVDSRAVTFGVREVKPVLADPETGEKRFRFDVNGQPVFMRGANWAPIEGTTHVWPSERAKRLLDLAEHANMNILRLWAEGHIPPQEFYDECDRRGIFIWQDFMFGYNMHPTDDPELVELYRAEIEEMIRRLRNHPCVLLWCGGNENHMGWDFDRGGLPDVGNELFEEIMPDAVRRLDPDRLFHPSSPYGGRVPNWPLEGDWHDYTTLTFSPEASVPLFASEMIRVSPPSLASMRRFLSDAELWPEGHDPAVRTPGQPAWPPMWQYRSVAGSWEKVGAVEDFCDPASAEDLIRVLGTAHGEYLQERIERERRGVPDGAPDGSRRCWGNMAWRLNDAWPIIYSSVIDYYLEPKIAYYFIRRAYEPVLISFERTADRIFLWIVNDYPEPAAGTLVVRRSDLTGRVRGEFSTTVEVKPGEAKCCLDLTEFGPITLRSEFLRADFGGREATYLLIGERRLHLPDAHLTVTRTGDRVEIATDVFARQVTLEFPGVTGAIFEDNFFDLSPGRRRTVRILDAAGGDKLKVRALNAEAVSV